MQNLCKSTLLLCCDLPYVLLMAPRHDHALKMPGRPVRNQQNKMLIRKDEPLTLCQQEAVLLHYLRFYGCQCCKIIFKNKSRSIGWVVLASGPKVARVEVAMRIVSRPGGCRGRFDFALPRPLRALGRTQHPLARENVKARCGASFKFIILLLTP